MATWSWRIVSSVVHCGRRLWLPIPPSDRDCRCGLPLDPRGHHRAACATAGVLGRRGFALESAAARVCREAGARVSSNVRVQDMDLVRPDALDNRRLEIVADGLPLFLGAQLAVDTTLVSVLRRDGSPRPRCANEDGAALAAARRRKEGTYRSSRVATGGRWPARLGDGGPRRRKTSSGRRATALEGPSSSSLAVEVGDLAGVQCCKGLRTFSA